MTIVKGDKTIHTEKEWENYYQFLENIRQSGICNMWGATPYIMDAFHLNYEDAATVLCNWIQNYEELNKKYGWR